MKSPTPTAPTLYQLKKWILSKFPLIFPHTPPKHLKKMYKSKISFFTRKAPRVPWGGGGLKSKNKIKCFLKFDFRGSIFEKILAATSLLSPENLSNLVILFKSYSRISKTQTDGHTHKSNVTLFHQSFPIFAYFKLE